MVEPPGALRIPDSLSELSGLAVVPADALLLHEAHDPARLERLKDRIVSDGKQSNPIIASRVVRSDSEDGFLVLDGAHRAETLRAIGCRFALVQLVGLPEYAEGWRHLLSSGMPGEDEIVARLEDISGSGDEAVAEVMFSDGRTFPVRVSPGRKRVETLREIQSLYPSETNGVVRRLAPGEEVEAEAGRVIIDYRPFPTEGIVEEISWGRTLPAGVTRFTVPGRVLGVGMPLELLFREDPSEASRWLDEAVSSRLAENRIRRYEEPVTLFE